LIDAIWMNWGFHQLEGFQWI